MSAYDIPVQLSGTDGNTFAIIGVVCRALKSAGEVDAAEMFLDQAMSAGSYDAVLRLCMETVDVH